MFDSFEEMTNHIQQANEEARSRITPEQWRLADGNEHWAVALESQGADALPIIMATHVLSRQQFITQQLKYIDPEEWGTDGESVEEAVYPINSYYGENGMVSTYGYLPCESWDSFYDVDEPDLHDRHASILMEITEDEFNEIRAIRQNPEIARMIPSIRSVLLRWIETVAS
jgi:hypothetical protein